MPQRYPRILLSEISLRAGRAEGEWSIAQPPSIQRGLANASMIEFVRPLDGLCDGLCLVSCCLA